jgi:hypothetical protein
LDEIKPAKGNGQEKSAEALAVYANRRAEGARAISQRPTPSSPQTTQGQYGFLFFALFAPLR